MQLECQKIKPCPFLSRKGHEMRPKASNDVNATSFWEMGTVATMPSVLLIFSCLSQEFLTFPAFHRSRLGLPGYYAADRSGVPLSDP